MDKYIVSDLHGNGEVYKSIINYLENQDKDITLYINGDLIDRGFESANMLVDVINRMENPSKLKIKYLAGNHEFMMYQAALKRKDYTWPKHNIWFKSCNGGAATLANLQGLVDTNREEEIINIISNLQICHKFEEKLNGKNIVLSHAMIPRKIDKILDIRLKDNYLLTGYYLWARTDDFVFPSEHIGTNKYFGIVGHSVVNKKTGYWYCKKENYLNIDGGCACYATGYDSFDHVPLVKVENEILTILTFNHNNEIIYGNYFDGDSFEMDEVDLSSHRKYLSR